ncbi:hypothetical protein M407DRAFT_182601 [Tulasnella calospora MUT 4182]|uniref:Uncharacterized protein n=1 Tax=Tulasnella calospora MUT 4182 TaxID=1051891 RepID=A0A0C3QL57_9AGAM|nr:hypothetical protein M407DRAFT_182601 [Tulasnella calospora MUT 4182]
MGIPLEENKASESSCLRHPHRLAYRPPCLSMFRPLIVYLVVFLTLCHSTDLFRWSTVGGRSPLTANSFVWPGSRSPPEGNVGPPS